MIEVRHLRHEYDKTVALENLLDERYRFVPNLALVDQPGRQVVVATELNF